MQTILAYKRSNGEIGIRNYILIISLVQCANSTAFKIAAACNCQVITIDTGCGEFREDEARTNLGLIRAGQHPNIFGVLLNSLGCQWTRPEVISEEISKQGKRVEHLCIQREGGTEETIKKGIDIVNHLKKGAAREKRKECPVSSLRLGVYCGGSDWTSSLAAHPLVGECVDLFASLGAGFVSSPIRGMPGGEQHLIELAINEDLENRILDISEEYRKDIEYTTGQKLSDVNPTPGNKANGITTLREKAISNLKLSGTRTKLRGVLDLGERIKEPGFWIIDNRKGGNDIYACTALAMSGAHLCLFTTGQGTPIGTAAMVTMKVCANPETIRNLGEDMIDFDASSIIEKGDEIGKIATSLKECVIGIANGSITKSERFGDSSWATPPMGRI